MISNQPRQKERQDIGKETGHTEGFYQVEALVVGETLILYVWRFKSASIRRNFRNTGSADNNEMLVQITVDKETGTVVEVAGGIVKEPGWNYMAVCHE